MKVLSGTTIVLASFLSTTVVFADDRVIYGVDDRKDLYDPDVDSALLELAASTAVLIKDSQIRRDSPTSEFVKLPSETFKASMGTCDEERFNDQVNAGFCSGFLVGPDLFVTAGHCITSESECKKISMVFDYAMTSADRDLTKMPSKEVYHCKSIVKRELQPGTQGRDYALVRLDRVVEGRRPLAIRREGKLAENEGIAVIGHPSGLPTKIADGAKVRKNEDSKPYFVANLDTYGGNSGSAVFNIATGEVEGILVRGETDFIYDSDKSCFKSNVCTEAGCNGEDVTKISFLVDHIPVF